MTKQRKYEAQNAPEHISDFLNTCYEAGEAAGSWVIDGNTTEETMQTLRRGIEDGDPMILDSLPTPQWGGEWADEPTYEALATEAGLTEDETDDYYGEALLAFSAGVEDEVQRTLAAYLD